MPILPPAPRPPACKAAPATLTAPGASCREPRERRLAEEARAPTPRQPPRGKSTRCSTPSPTPNPHRPDRRSAYADHRPHRSKKARLAPQLAPRLGPMDPHRATPRAPFAHRWPTCSPSARTGPGSAATPAAGQGDTPAIPACGALTRGSTVPALGSWRSLPWSSMRANGCSSTRPSCTCGSARAWRLLAVNVLTNHAHVVLSGGGAPEEMMTAFKACSTRMLREGARRQRRVPRMGAAWEHAVPAGTRAAVGAADART